MIKHSRIMVRLNVFLVCALCGVNARADYRTEARSICEFRLPQMLLHFTAFNPAVSIGNKSWELYTSIRGVDYFGFTWDLTLKHIYAENPQLAYRMMREEIMPNFINLVVPPIDTQSRADSDNQGGSSADEPCEVLCRYQLYQPYHSNRMLGLEAKTRNKCQIHAT